MDSLMLRYFREEGVVTYKNVSIAVIAPNLILPANRLRYAIILPNSSATRFIWHFGEAWNLPQIGWFSTTVSSTGCINEDVFGEAIRLPLWGWCDTANQTEVAEISYDPTRYAQMMRYVNAQLSKHGAS